MKRHLVLILFTLALLAALAISVSAAPSTDPAELNKVYDAAVKMTTDQVFAAGGTIENVTCPYCQEPVTWKPLPAITTTTGIAGHYYLDQDFTSNPAIYQTGGARTCIHLNGHTIKTTNAVAATFWVKSGQELNIMGEGSVTGNGSKTAGVLYSLGTIRLFGGTYSRLATNAYTISTSAANAVFEMYNGTTVNGMAVSTYAAIVNSYTTATLKMYGGTVDAKTGTAVLLYSGQFHQYGGIIKGAKRSNVIVDGGDYTLHDGSITGGLATISGGQTIGGNVRLVKGSFTMNGGTISSGLAYTDGGNVHITAGTFTMNAGQITGGSLSGGTSAVGGGSIYMAGGTFEMKGGTVSSGTATNGGNFFLAGGELKLNTGAPAIKDGKGTSYGGNIYMKAGTVTIDAGSVTQDVSKAGECGNIYMLTGATLNLNGGSIEGGKAAGGGCIRMEGGSFNMAGGEIKGGVGTAVGGNISIFSGSVEFAMTGGTISGGEAPRGGNIDINGSGAVVTMSGAATVSGGTASGSGGNIYVSSGTFNMEGGTVTKGTANKSLNANQYYYNGGGNIFVASTANISGGSITDGTAKQNAGGNILAYNGSKLTISGTTVISGGKAGAVGGNIMNGAGNVTISGGTITGGQGNTYANQNNEGDNIVSFGGTLTISGGTIGSNADDLGNGVLGYYNAKIILDGNPAVTNIYLANESGDATLQVLNTFTGTAGVNFHANHKAALGKTLALDSSTGPYTGKVYIENLHNATVYGTEDNKLQVAGILANDTWYQNNDAAMAAIDGNAAMKLYTSDALVLKGADYTVDLVGNSPAITGTGNVTVCDSANKNFKNFGTATIDGPTLVNTTTTTQNGDLYYTISQGNAHSFHCLQAKVSGVSVRPSSAGVYYSCIWNCDSTLLAALDVDSYGVALSVVDMPDAQFKSANDTLYTLVEGKFEPGVRRNSVLVDKILKTGESTNQARAEMDIFAVPYMVVGGETLIGTGVQYSLQDIVGLMDKRENYYPNRVALESFYKNWESVMADWDLTNIGKVPLDPAEDDTLKILMVGNSYCYYFAEELYALLAENMPEGINKVEVYNLYRGGCTMQEHYERWTGVQNSNYQLWKTDSTGRALQGGGYTTTLEEALALDNWDCISMQEGLSKFWFGTQEEDLAECRQYAEPIIDRIRQVHPNAKLLWHETWSQEIGYVGSRDEYAEDYVVEDAADQAAYEAKEKYVAEEMCKAYDMIRVNSGEAWAEARKSDLITNLCARLGVNRFPEGTANSGDGFHDGDIGGGQLLNAYVWYMVLTGDTTVTDTVYRPNYDLAENVVAVLQAAAEATIAAR